MALTIGQDKLSSKVGFFLGHEKIAILHTDCSAPLFAGINEQNQKKSRGDGGDDGG